MHKLHDKKEGKTHYFHHVTEQDGKKKHVYLGTDRSKAQERLTKLKVERIRSSNKLIKELDKVQTKLDMLTHNNRTYDDKIADVRKQHYAEQNIKTMLGDEAPRPFPSRAFLISGLAVAGVVGLAVLVFSNPSVTGAAVTAVSEVITTRAFMTSIMLSVGVLALGLFFYGATHHSDHRHDKYKPQF